MIPDYYLCDNCGKGEVRKASRIHAREYNMPGEINRFVVDLCPKCMPICLCSVATAGQIKGWIKDNK